MLRSSTDLVFSIPRIFKGDTAEDTKAVQPLINQVVFYPLSTFDGTMKTVDWSKVPHVPVSLRFAFHCPTALSVSPIGFRRAAFRLFV